MNQGLLLLQCWNGKKIKDWREIISLLRLVDINIDYRSHWDCIRRNFLYNYDLWMDIVDGVFVCRPREPEDDLNTPIDQLNRLRHSKYWDNSLTEYELTHSPEETLKEVRKQLSRRAVSDLGLND